MRQFKAEREWIIPCDHIDEKYMPESQQLMLVRNDEPMWKPINIQLQDIHFSVNLQ